MSAIDRTNFRECAKKALDKYGDSGRLLDAILWGTIVRLYEEELSGPQSTGAPPRRGAVWGYGDHQDAEYWLGQCATREEAIAEGRRELAICEIPAFYVIQGSWIDPAEYFVADDIFERASDDLYDNAPEDAEFKMPKEALPALKALLADWCARYVSVDKWQAEGKPERIEMVPSGKGETT